MDIIDIIKYHLNIVKPNGQLRLHSDTTKKILNFPFQSTRLQCSYKQVQQIASEFVPGFLVSGHS